MAKGKAVGRSSSSASRKVAAKKTGEARKTTRRTVASDAVGKGDRVQWNYAAGKAVGKVLQVFREKISKTIKGARITRRATPEKPAALVKSDKGGEALKSASELKRLP